MTKVMPRQRLSCILYLLCVPPTMTSVLTTMSSTHHHQPSLPLRILAEHANAYSAAHGLQVEERRKNKKNDNNSSSSGTSGSTYKGAPISLLPNAYPSSSFRKAQTLALPFNVLVDRISRDSNFLVKTLGSGVSDADPYTGKLLSLYKKLYSNIEDDGEGKFARLADRLGILRSDYMLNPTTKTGGVGGEGDIKGKYELKQVELNTIAASFAGLAVNVAKLHRHLVQRFDDEVKGFLDGNKVAVMGEGYEAKGDTPEEEEGVPVNPALECLPAAMNVAHERYKERFVSGNNEEKGGLVKTVVLFVVQEGETNTVDQRMLEFALWEGHGVPVVRMSLTRAHTELVLDGETGSLRIRSNDGGPPVEVSVVYFRAGYAPTDYPDGDDGIEWSAREMIERSRATKCPCLGYHLAGTKKVQQELARPGTLERFFPESNEKSEVEMMRSAFAGLHSLGNDATDEDRAAVKDAISGQEGRYVLKPQREGGGYNYYGDKLATKLRDNMGDSSVPSSELELGPMLAEFILMERLFPPQQKAVLLRGGLLEGTGDSISELGCFGTVVTSPEGTVVHNQYAGFLLRTKFSNVDEGGVASGFATLSSPYLC